jgi:hypothetical protein
MVQSRVEEKQKVGKNWLINICGWWWGEEDKWLMVEARKYHEIRKLFCVRVGDGRECDGGCLNENEIREVKTLENTMSMSLYAAVLL